MFALPGFLLLLVFLVGRPFELIPAAQGLPFLYIFCGLTLLGLLVDLRTKFTEVRTIPFMVLAGAFMAWCLFTTLLFARHQLMYNIIELAIIFFVYVVAAHAIHTFKSFEIVAGTYLMATLWLCFACISLDLESTQCIVFHPGEDRLTDLGHPDGRPCDLVLDCNDNAPPGTEFSCEKASVLGLTTVANRVRYIGTLADPNEVAMVISTSLPIAFAFYRRKKTLTRALFAAAVTGVIAWTVLITQSRGGLLTLMVVMAVTMILKFGAPRVAFFGAPAALGVIGFMMARAAAREDGDASTHERLGCLDAGMTMFKMRPPTGVGMNEFMTYHDLTAHNSYVLAAAELGLIGMVMWVLLLYFCFKFVNTARLHFAGRPEAEVGVIWAESFMASIAGLCVGIFFLTFAYHQVFWLFLGLIGALYSCVRHHDKRFVVKLAWQDLTLVSTACVGLLVTLTLYLKMKL